MVVDMPPPSLTPDQLAKAERQRDNLKRRIKQNVKAFVSEEWDKLQTTYKPAQGAIKQDDIWLTAVKQQADLMAKINTAKKAKEKGEYKIVYEIIMDIREKYPNECKKIPAPEKPAVPKQASLDKPAPFSGLPPMSPPPTYESEAPSSKKGFESTDHNSSAPIKREPSRSPPITIAGSSSSPEPDGDDDDAKDDTFDPALTQTREGRAAKRLRTKGPEVPPKVKSVTSRIDLMFQLDELRLQFQLKEIAIQKRIAGLEGKSDFDLCDKELEKQFELRKLQLGRKKAMAMAKGEEGGQGAGV